MIPPMPEPDPSAAPATERRIYCLCAEWCGVCREWRAAFEALAAAPQPGERFVWVDVDAHDAVLDAIEIETFPVLLVAHQGRAVFCGPVEPTPARVRRLLDGLARDPARPDRAAQAVLQALGGL